MIIRNYPFEIYYLFCVEIEILILEIIRLYDSKDFTFFTYNLNSHLKIAMLRPYVLLEGVAVGLPSFPTPESLCCACMAPMIYQTILLVYHKINILIIIVHEPVEERFC